MIFERKAGAKAGTADPSQGEFVYVLWVNLSKAITVMVSLDQAAGRTALPWPACPWTRVAMRVCSALLRFSV